jgi:hypothetical protein
MNCAPKLNTAHAYFDLKTFMSGIVVWRAESAGRLMKPQILLAQPASTES